MRAKLLARLLELRLGLTHPGLRSLELAFGLITLCLGVDAALDQLEDARRLLLGVAELGAGVGNGSLRRRDAGRAGADRLARLVDRRFRLSHRHLVGLRVDAEEELALLGDLIVDHADLDHVAGNFGGDAHDVGLDRGLRAVRCEPISDQVVGEDRQAHRQDHPDPRPRAPVRCHGCPFPSGQCTALVHARVPWRSDQKVKLTRTPPSSWFASPRSSTIGLSSASPNSRLKEASPVIDQRSARR